MLNCRKITALKFLGGIAYMATSAIPTYLTFYGNDSQKFIGTIGLIAFGGVSCITGALWCGLRGDNNHNQQANPLLVDDPQNYGAVNSGVRVVSIKFNHGAGHSM